MVFSIPEGIVPHGLVLMTDSIISAIYSRVSIVCSDMPAPVICAKAPPTK